MKKIIFFTLYLLLPSFISGQELSKERWSIKYFSSEETSGEGTKGRASQIIDDDLSTYWHSRWTSEKAELPHEIQIDLGDSCSISGIKLWPRQGNCSGKPVQYEYYLSKDGSNWGNPIVSGTFLWTSSNDNNPQLTTFTTTKCRYIRFRQLSTYACGSGGIGCIAEMSVIGKYSKLYTTKVLKQPSEHILPNSTNNIILPIMVEVYDSKPLKLTQLKFNTEGTSNLHDISTINVYYTGSSSVFSSSSLVGKSSSIVQEMNITGDILLSPGRHYLWITYDIVASAATGNYLNANLQSVTVSDSIIIPSVASSTEKRMIMGVQLTECPMNKQLYPRNRTTNMAPVMFKGIITGDAHSNSVVKVVVSRNNIVIDTMTIIPKDDGDMSSFAATYNLKAELQNYTFRVFSVNNNKWYLAYIAQEVVAGDAYIVTGQSNAVATIWWGETTSEIENPFIRTYGSGVATGNYTKGWFKAITHDPNGSVANGAACDGQVGVLGLSIARQLVDSYSIPVAILNGAHGGKEIAFFGKEESNPTDINTNYGRLLTRLDESKLKNNVEAIIWYQGETDGSFATSQNSYTNSFTKLHSAWKKDLPTLKKIYVFQIKQGCSTAADNINIIQEVQRKLPNLFDDVELMSTNPIAQQEGCHFPKAGYVTHATNVVRLMKKDFFNDKDTVAINPPNIISCRLNKANELIIHTDCKGDLVWENGAHNYFKLHNTSIKITGGRVDQSNIYLTTSIPFTAITNIKLSYLGKDGTGSPTIKNTKGIGILCFNQAVISKMNQTISFKPFVDSIFSNNSIPLTATSNSGLPISYRSSDTSITSIEENRLYIHRPGIVTITASQAGNSLYQAAEEISQMLHISSLSAIPEYKTQTTQIYPNPVDRYLTIHSETPINDIEIITASGQKTPYWSVRYKQTHEWNIDVSELSKGIYFIYPKNHTKKITPMKFIKK